jgi:transcription elongation factor S-II
MTLDIKGVERKRADLDKALKNGDPSTTIISLLTELRNGVVPSDKLLRDTKIGVQVNRLKMHKDPQVAKLASEMVSRWKAEMQKQKQGTSGASTPKPAANGASASPRAAATASPVPVKAEKKKYTGDVAKRNVKVDGMDDKANCTGNASRDGCVKLMYNGIAFMSDECACCKLPQRAIGG